VDICKKYKEDSKQIKEMLSKILEYEEKEKK
jgi:hypothetical protein